MRENYLIIHLLTQTSKTEESMQQSLGVAAEISMWFQKILIQEVGIKAVVGPADVKSQKMMNNCCSESF